MKKMFDIKNEKLMYQYERHKLWEEYENLHKTIEEAKRTLKNAEETLLKNRGQQEMSRTNECNYKPTSLTAEKKELSNYCYLAVVKSIENGKEYVFRSDLPVEKEDLVHCDTVRKGGMFGVVIRTHQTTRGEEENLAEFIKECSEGVTLPLRNIDVVYVPAVKLYKEERNEKAD